MATNVIVRRLEPVHDPEAFQRAMEILGCGLRRGLRRLRQVRAAEQHLIGLETPHGAQQWAFGRADPADPAPFSAKTGGLKPL